MDVLGVVRVDGDVAYLESGLDPDEARAILLSALREVEGIPESRARLAPGEKDAVVGFSSNSTPVPPT